MPDEAEKERYYVHKEMLFTAIRGRQETLVAYGAIAAGLLVVATFNQELIPTSKSVRYLVLLLLAIIPFSLAGYLLELKEAEDRAEEYFKQFGKLPKQSMYRKLLAYWPWLGFLILFITVLWMALLIVRPLLFLSINTTSVPQANTVVTNSANHASNNVMGWLQIIGPLFLGIVAIFGKQVRQIFFKPQLEFISALANNQDGDDDTLIMYRIAIKNTGWAAANEVRAVLSSIRDNDNNERKNFIPIPLNWTHVDKNTRSISRQEDVMLDVVMISSQHPRLILCWPGGKRPLESDLSLLENDNVYLLTIDFFERDNRLQSVVVEWSPGDWKIVST